jgi:hypothetical protein
VGIVLVVLYAVALLFFAAVTLGMLVAARRTRTDGALRWRRFLLPVQAAILVAAALGLAVTAGGESEARRPLGWVLAAVALVTVALVVRAVTGLRARRA